MAQTCIWGVDASVTLPTGMGALFNAFTYDLTQSAPEAVGFGLADALVKGAVRRVTGMISGQTTYKTTNDVPGHSVITQTAQAITLTFFTGCTLAFNAVFTALSLRVALEASDQSSYSYTRSGPTTETWATT